MSQRRSFEYLIRDIPTRDVLREIWDAIDSVGGGGVTVSTSEAWAPIANAEYNPATAFWHQSNPALPSWAGHANADGDYLRIVRAASGSADAVNIGSYSGSGNFWSNALKVTNAEAILYARHLFFGTDDNKDIGSPTEGTAEDNFNRADADSLGPNWTESEGPPPFNLQISANACFVNGPAMATWTGMTFYSDHYAQGDMSKSTVVTRRFGLGVRLTGTSTVLTGYVLLYFDTNSSWKLYRYLSANIGGDPDVEATLIGSFTQAIVNGQTVYLSANGSTIQVKVNGIVIIQVVDSVLEGSSSSPGILGGGGTDYGLVDNFVAASLAASDFGRPRSLYLGTSLWIENIKLYKGAASRLDVNAGQRLTGALDWATDAVYDIGASAANRPRDLYLAESVFFGADVEAVRGAANRLDVLDALRLTGKLDFATDNTYDIGTTATTFRPRDIFVGRHLYLTDFTNAAHDHQDVDDGGKLDHGLALDGLLDDDHTQYVLRSLLTTLGDLPYGGAAGAWTRLAGQITTTKKFLRQTGTGAASAAPAWDTIVAGDIAELLALADLSDVTAKTGTGTTVVMDTSPTIVTPTIASFLNATHAHQSAAGGGFLDAAAINTGILPGARGGTNTGVLDTDGIVYMSTAGTMAVNVVELHWDSMSKFLGMGTSGPAFHIDIHKDTLAEISLRGHVTATGGARFSGKTGRGSLLFPAVVQADDLLAIFAGQGMQKLTAPLFSGDVVAMKAHAAETFSTTAWGSYLTLWTTPIGTVTPTEALRLTSAQNAQFVKTVQTGTANRFRMLQSMVRATKSAVQILTTGALTTLTWPTETFDTDGLHDTATNNSRLTAPIAGKYLVTCGGGWANSAVGTRAIRIRKNAATDYAIERHTVIGSSTSHFMHVTALVDLAATDYVEALAMQDSGGDLDFSNILGFFQMVLVGE